nr:transposase [uncultured Roseateles sp.]
MEKVSGRDAARQTMPLCCGYFSVHFDKQMVSVLADGVASRDRAVVWALGVLSDGDREVMDVRPVPDADPVFWRGGFDRFLARGVERISFVFADAIAGVGLVYPGVAELPCFASIQRRGRFCLAASADRLGTEARRAVREAASVRGARVALDRLLTRSEARREDLLVADWPEVLAQLEPFYALRSERRTLVRRGDEVLECLGRNLSRAVGRHGPFADVDAAVSFVASTLARAEVRFSSSVPAAARLRACSASSMAARAGVAPSGH